jgi:hypothetical protein
MRSYVCRALTHLKMPRSRLRNPEYTPSDDLMYPTGLKIAARGRMSFVWSLAFRELTQATQLHVIGVSFSEGDFELRWLLREGFALRDHAVLGPVRIVIVNPSKAAQEAARLAFGRLGAGGASADITEFESVEDYLNRLDQLGR